jgi:hypothetical protein
MARPLTPAQQQAFEDRLKELGIDSSHVVASLNTGDTPGPTYLSNDPAHDSAIEPQALTINNVDDLKRLGGIADSEYDSGQMDHHQPVPPEWPQEKNEHALADLEPHERANLRQAFTSYVYGHSARVASYATAINNNFFPLDAAVYAVLDVTVTPQQPLIISGNNAGANFGTVTIEPGGQIIVETDATLTCQQMVMQ